MNAKGKIAFACLLLSVFFAGCAVFVPIQYSDDDKIVLDPSYLRVAYVNPTGYYLFPEGELTEPIGPYEPVLKNLRCPGTHRVVVHAYKEIGRSPNGKYVGTVFVGDQDITFYVRPTDSYNYNGQIVSRVVYFGSFYLNPRYPYENVHIPVYTPCSILLPNITIQKR
ncbi:hypothetical protein A3C91_03755 [Candidatus Azambacteria bacterium RIFCSPHIGHO2_02_FULL_52_12]|uniref:Lipoprotein n=1 Tax=Candidatus Azambacteria bacterium RIFCSPLOWO2_01_FULL_46_25 TaxID=1797298 RepID=A0A1F5BUP4_9BACT|nr:MAG: hypothetical protein A3C91_03755 [Candidatus Azambacteria bacterium RIFCSPHIGHO2_02_FULL_52_12]OGD34355.1 MAG: hypothetical protein A2988_02395 [Candidatus Azambacteria bacterium RIFCSPLOWO2_01_FULL_46_25]OGD37367.1 MAG: hypothetical protein A2850_01490 [Candidatus Azambacteria bacterium RIFCSPHIGHO2_01_FULL_51_74]